MWVVKSISIIALAFPMMVCSHVRTLDICTLTANHHCRRAHVHVALLHAPRASQPGRGTSNRHMHEGAARARRAKETPVRRRTTTCIMSPLVSDGGECQTPNVHCTADDSLEVSVVYWYSFT